MRIPYAYTAVSTSWSPPHGSFWIWADTCIPKCMHSAMCMWILLSADMHFCVLTYMASILNECVWQAKASFWAYSYIYLLASMHVSQTETDIFGFKRMLWLRPCEWFYIVHIYTLGMEWIRSIISCILEVSLVHAFQTWCGLLSTLCVNAFTFRVRSFDQVCMHS